MKKWPYTRWLQRMIFGILLAGCQTWNVVRESSFDQRFINIQTVSLFNQRASSHATSEPWRGDWLFRRHRLDLIDRQLRYTRPDLVVFQELMERAGSYADSDRNILAEGALRNYEWDPIDVVDYDDTQEVQYNTTAVALPLSFSMVPDDMKKFWSLGDDGYMTVSCIELENKPVLLMNVQMPSSMDQAQIWYQSVAEQIRQIWKTTPFCPERTIIAGYLPNQGVTSPLRKLLMELRFKDSSQGFCELASDCYSATPLNELFSAISDNSPPGQVDRILVHRSALVSQAMINFNKPEELPVMEKKYGLTSLWPTVRFGWNATVKLAGCRTFTEEM